EGEDSAWRTPPATTRIRRSHPLPDVRSWFLLLPRTAFAGVVRLRQADRITRTAIGVGQRSFRGCRQYSRPDTTIAARHDAGRHRARARRASWESTETAGMTAPGRRNPHGSTTRARARPGPPRPSR